MREIPLDAVPDITNNQVQIVSVSPTLAPQEVEQLITYPLEAAMTNLPDVVEVRSISRYGLSVITVVFEDGSKKTLGIMMPGEYEFNTGAPELMEYYAGDLDVLNSFYTGTGNIFVQAQDGVDAGGKVTLSGAGAWTDVYIENKSGGLVGPSRIGPRPDPAHPE